MVFFSIGTSLYDHIKVIFKNILKIPKKWDFFFSILKIFFKSHCLQKELNIPSRRAAYKPLLTLQMGKKYLQFALKYLQGVVDDWKKGHIF